MSASELRLVVSTAGKVDVTDPNVMRITGGVRILDVPLLVVAIALVFLGLSAVLGKLKAIQLQLDTKPD